MADDKKNGPVAKKARVFQSICAFWVPLANHPKGGMALMTAIADDGTAWDLKEGKEWVPAQLPPLPDKE